jgi:hypothetical protein
VIEKEDRMKKKPQSLFFFLQQENYKTTMKTYCIEIKPKQGWLLEKDFCSENSEIFSLLDYDEAVKCRYCMLQYYKV